MEMTGSFEHMLALIIVSMTAYLVADLTGGQPVYDMLLERSLAVREKIKRRIRRKRILLELPVGMGSQLAGTIIGKAAWPAGTLLVNVRRGGEELSPQGGLRLQDGDYLYILTDERDTWQLQELARERVIDKQNQ